MSSAAAFETGSDTMDSGDMLCFDTEAKEPGSVLALILSNSVGCLFILVAWAVREWCWQRSSGIVRSNPGAYESGCRQTSGQVLSVDDEQINQQVMQSLLWDQNYELVQMPSGEAALEFIDKAPWLPDMVLLDVTLPGMSGFELKRGVTLIAQFHENVTILFSDIRGFTNLAAE
ncbi:hypothetical protein DUNSADRAFT_10000 [Dunaliella salina]|uniref:Response regulator n=1 Tax=Dunaliella salina TaxID=3046 RepID=A0ABQ7GGB0_DUNSA|nr:hypothetical protein DUNSADRAFT_10000 [Dunaliella salina]|eukprot:KAF5833621.1 hypothetical protein DUNSADRAFT_10000 [Dunaliella salina]